MVSDIWVVMIQTTTQRLCRRFHLADGPDALLDLEDFILPHPVFQG